MKTIVLAALTVLSFAGVAQAEVPRCNDSRELSTLPAGTKIYTGRPVEFVATLENATIGSSNCFFRVTATMSDRVTAPNMVLTTSSATNGDGTDSTASITATTEKGESFDVVCKKQPTGQSDYFGRAIYSSLNVGDFERALESAGGQMILPPVQQFQ